MTNVCCNSRKILEAILERPKASNIVSHIFNGCTALCIRAYIPDVKPETLEVMSGRRYIIITGQSKNQESFKQVIRLPVLIKKNEVYAEFDHGILVMKMPKAKKVFVL